MRAGLDESSIAEARAWRAAAPVELHERLASTNDRLDELAASGAPEGTLVLALEQLQGRGRHGRAWASPPGGLYFSFLLRPDEAMSQRLPATLLGGLAVCQALEAFAPPHAPPQLKWPNDVLLAGRKVAGVLGEMSRGPEGNRLLIGVGINLAADPRQAAPELREVAASLGEVTPAPDAVSVLRAFFGAFAALHALVEAGREAEVLAAAAARMPLLGQRVQVRLPQRVARGVFSGLSASGGLVLESEGGARRDVLLAGEVERLRPQ